jgi:hypothetical protein
MREFYLLCKRHSGLTRFLDRYSHGGRGPRNRSARSDEADW